MKMRFPQFICLVGPRPQAHALYAELQKRHDLTHMDFCDPIIEATLTTFYNNLQIDVDAEWSNTIPNTLMRFGEWVNCQAKFMKSIHGPDILGKIFLKYYLENGWQDLFPTLIIRDAKAEDYKVLLDHFGKDSCHIVITDSDPVKTADILETTSSLFRSVA
jgi:hypothetical protein